MRRIAALTVLAALVAGGCASRTVRARPTTPAVASTRSASPATSPSVRPGPSPQIFSPRPSAAPSRTPPRPSAGLPPWLAGHDVTVLPTTSKVVALTFDAGANADAVSSILSTLATYRVPGTFFLTGAWTRAYPEQAREIGSRYPVGNHSFDHPDLTTLADSEVRTEITEAEAAILGATGRDPRPLFRFPFGASDAALVAMLNSMGYGCFRWTVDTLGWQGTKAGTAEDVVSRVLDGLRPGEIVIMHVGSNPEDHTTLDADGLPKVIEALQARGYGFVTLDQFV
jgi:peptidoglycan/xylan/chitin deacetylase (PgdA/CDA1 family)